MNDSPKMRAGGRATEAGIEACRALRIKGLDPLEERLKQRQAEAAQATEVVTFEKCAETYIAAHKAGWKKHAEQWTATLQTYVYPVFKNRPVASIAHSS